MYNNYLEHYGVKGMHWGVRRYQNEDGSLTDVGRSRQNVRDSRAEYKAKNKELTKAYRKARTYSGTHYVSQFANKKHKDTANKLWVDTFDKAAIAGEAQRKYEQTKKRHRDKYGITIDAKHVETGKKIAKALLIGGAAVYGGRKLNSRLVSQMQKSALNLGKKQAKQSFQARQQAFKYYDLADKAKLFTTDPSTRARQINGYTKTAKYFDRLERAYDDASLKNYNLSKQNDYTLSEKANYLRNRKNYR